MKKQPPVLHLENINYAYAGGQQVLNDLSLTVHAGEKIGLVGHNGSGKTTFFHIVMGLLSPHSGRMKAFGEPVETEKDFQGIRQRIGLLFQDADDQLFSPTVLEDVAFGPLNQGKSTREAVKIARQTLESLGLGGFESRITHKLSGGEKRLVALATVLAMQPDVLLLDEPTAGLDDATRGRLQQILLGLNMTYIVISHEFDFLSRVTNTIYLMKDGKILTDAAVRVHQHFHAHVHGDQPHDHHPPSH